ncbi:flagellar hook assembly protein FlgD [Marinobacterium aestuariivivens]|uniref:FlgD immunoglobulin-like domain containing protein n=1 Tax=Marinobacterium aestuariivivens TaxID=1698799 RepID=A0ABW2A1N3_9GAMM
MAAVRITGLLTGLLLSGGALAESASQAISDTTINSNAFNPSLGEQVVLTYTLAQPDTVSVRVYDPDGGLVSTVLEGVEQAAGAQEISWDGLDIDSKVVPDEAYTFVVETTTGALYDPTTHSGGVVGDITEARFNEDGTVLYNLPAAARTLIRLGVHNGPMLKTLVDWKPRVAGEITEYWDGYDEDNRYKLRGAKDFSALITYVTLPDATVITYGNKEETYRDYKLGRAQGRAQKPDRPRRSGAELELRPEGLVPPAWARSPRVDMTFPQLSGVEKDDVPEVQDAIDIHISVNPDDLDHLLQDQFEIIFFLDNVFFAEAERGYLPLNWRWELQQIPPGEHVLTANVSSFTGQVGVASRKIKIVRPQ